MPQMVCNDLMLVRDVSVLAFTHLEDGDRARVTPIRRRNNGVPNACHVQVLIMTINVAFFFRFLKGLINFKQMIYFPRNLHIRK